MQPRDLTPWRQDIPGVAAHRGGRFLAPENTIFGILEGLGAGATHLEVDVRGTADGHAVCFHDASAKRTCREDVEIEELTLEEVKDLDPCAKWGDYRGIATGEREAPRGMRPRHFQIPELKDVLETFTGVPTILDIKDTAPVDAVVDAIESGWQRHPDLLLGGFDDEKIQRVANEVEDVPRTAGYEGAEAFFAGEPVDAEAIVVPPEHEGIELVDEEAVERAHDQDAGFWVWTINEAETARKLFDRGIDGIITDQPDKLTYERARLM